MSFRNSIAFLLIGCTLWSIHASPVVNTDLDPPRHLWDQEGSDMILTPEQLEAAKSGITNPQELWPGGVVTYNFDDSWSRYTPAEWVEQAQNNVKKAMDMISASTCITFKARTPGSSDFYINIKPTSRSVCNSNVGRANVAYGETSTEMNLSTEDYCINDKGAIAHEFIHTIGFWHEQQRPDRDQYITVLPQNFNGDQSANYGIQPGTKVYGTPYDFKSIMHYGPKTSATVNYSPAFIPNPDKWDGSYIGQTTYLTRYDQQKINNMYSGLC